MDALASSDAVLIVGVHSWMIKYAVYLLTKTWVFPILVGPGGLTAPCAFLMSHTFHQCAPNGLSQINHKTGRSRPCDLPTPELAVAPNLITYKNAPLPPLPLSSTSKAQHSRDAQFRKIDFCIFKISLLPLWRIPGLLQRPTSFLKSIERCESWADDAAG